MFDDLLQWLPNFNPAGSAQAAPATAGDAFIGPPAPIPPPQPPSYDSSMPGTFSSVGPRRSSQDVSGTDPTSYGSDLATSPVPGANATSSELAPAGPAAAAAATKPGDLASILRGVQAPKPPEVQKVSTPAAPRPTGHIQSGELLQLLMKMGNPAAQPHIPYSLSGAIGGR